MPSDSSRYKLKERIQLPFPNVKVPVVLLSTGLNHTLSSEALRFTGEHKSRPAEILNAALATAVFWNLKALSY